MVCRQRWRRQLRHCLARMILEALERDPVAAASDAPGAAVRSAGTAAGAARVQAERIAPD